MLLAIKNGNAPYNDLPKALVLRNDVDAQVDWSSQIPGRTVVNSDPPEGVAFADWQERGFKIGFVDDDVALWKLGAIAPGGSVLAIDVEFLRAAARSSLPETKAIAVRAATAGKVIVSWDGLDSAEVDWVDGAKLTIESAGDVVELALNGSQPTLPATEDRSVEAVLVHQLAAQRIA